jgi:DNA-binding XRE family transcriptional regulator/molybdate-binding protein
MFLAVMEADALHRARIAAGLSQAGLAAAAGISRQAVGAIEAGRHRPSVDAALAIARALGCRVEDVFAPAPAASEPVLAAVPDGAPVLAARVGERVVHAAAGQELAFGGWPRGNGVLEGGRVRLLPGADLDGLVVVGCDPALGSAAAMLPPGGPQRLIALSGSTGTAVRAMRDGRAHGATVHGRAGRMPALPSRVLRLHLARWRVGVASRGPRARSVAELCEQRVRVVQREDGASSQKAFLAAVAAQAGAGAAPVGPVAAGHVEVARRVADGEPAGVTIEPAALQYGLAFAALEEHVVEVWIDARWRDHPAVAALGNLLRSSPFTTRLDLVGGYELAHCGTQKEPQE